MMTTTSSEQKKILLVDDDQNILTTFQYSLEDSIPSCYVATAGNGFEALDILHEQPFDVVVTDFNIPGMDGLELIETIRYLQPETRIIIMTGYDIAGIEDEAHRLQVYRYLTKPVSTGDFQQTIMAALDAPPQKQSNISTTPGHEFDQIDQILAQLETDINAQGLVLTDLGGKTIARMGHTKDLPLQELASLLGGAIATLQEIGRLLKAQQEAMDLTYRQGSKNRYLYAVNVGQQYLLILIIGHNTYSSRTGTIWYYVRQTAQKLAPILAHLPRGRLNSDAVSTLGQLVNQELDNLLQ